MSDTTVEQDTTAGLGDPVGELEQCLDVLRRHLELEVQVGEMLNDTDAMRDPGTVWPSDPTINREIVLTALWQTIELTSNLFASWWEAQRQLLDLRTHLENAAGQALTGDGQVS